MLTNEQPRLRIKQAVVVEGKYDKIKLSAVIDAVIIVTNGFGIYKNSETADLIRFYARSSGIIILTDSDTAGARIRGHIKSIVSEGEIISLYVPEIFGKEKRKTSPSKEGKLGVEGMSVQILRETFEKAGLLSEDSEPREKITKQDMYELGLSGGADSREKRRHLCASLSLPENLSAPALLDALNTLMDRPHLRSYMNGIADERKE
jgi:ribonuclease M5